MFRIYIGYTKKKIKKIPFVPMINEAKWPTQNIIGNKKDKKNPVQLRAHL